MKEGGTMPAAMSAANEIAVAAFLEKKIGFMDIPKNNRVDDGKAFQRRL